MFYSYQSFLACEFLGVLTFKIFKNWLNITVKFPIRLNKQLIKEIPIFSVISFTLMAYEFLIKNMNVLINVIDTFFNNIIMALM